MAHQFAHIHWHFWQSRKGGVMVSGLARVDAKALDKPALKG